MEPFGVGNPAPLVVGLGRPARRRPAVRRRGGADRAAPARAGGDGRQGRRLRPGRPLAEVRQGGGGLGRRAAADQRLQWPARGPAPDPDFQAEDGAMPHPPEPDPGRAIVRQLRQKGIQDRTGARRHGPGAPAAVRPPRRRATRRWTTAPSPIGCDQTISQPFIVAVMTVELALTGVERVLEIGTGSGYQTAMLARLAARSTRSSGIGRSRSAPGASSTASGSRTSATGPATARSAGPRPRRSTAP